MKKGFIIKLILISLIIILVNLTISNKSYAQLNYTLEGNFGYNLLITDSKILYENSNYTLYPNYMYFPFGITITATNSPYVLIDIGMNYEQRFLNRRTTYQGLEEDFEILLHLIKFPIHIRINLPYYNLFILTGFSMNFVIGAEFSGTMMKYGIDHEKNKTKQQDPPSTDDIEVINIDDPLFTGEESLLRENFNTADYTLNIGIGWKYVLNEQFYTIVQLRFEFSIIDIDRSLYYETYLHSLILMGSFGINL